MTCEEVRATIAGTNVYDQTPSTILAVVNHIKDCESCNAWRKAGLEEARKSLDEEYGAGTTDAVIAGSMSQLINKVNEVRDAALVDPELRCQ